MTEHPTISVQEDFDRGFVLMATSYNMTATAGPRLFKAPPHPSIKFVHEDRESAERDAVILQEYIETSWPKGKESKASLRKRTESRA